MHPGNAQTDVTRDFPPLVHTAYMALQPLFQCAQASPADCATTSVFAVAASDPRPLRGAYLERSTVITPSDDVADVDAGRRLLELCEKLLGRWLGDDEGPCSDGGAESI